VSEDWLQGRRAFCGLKVALALLAMRVAFAGCGERSEPHRTIAALMRFARALTTSYESRSAASLCRMW